MGSKQIVDPDRPGIVKLLMHFMISVNIHGKIRPYIIRYPVSIPVGVKCSERIIITENANRKGNRTTCIIREIQRYTETVINTIVRDERGGVWLVIVCRIPVSLIHQLALCCIIGLYERP